VRIIILTALFAQLAVEEQPCAWFQQDLAAAHTTDDILTALEGVSGDNIGLISCLWPPRSPDITVFI
jgi:hypothetical protein